MQLIDGKSLAQRLRVKLAQHIQTLSIKPKLGVILVGDNPASKLYVTMKAKAAEEIGINIDGRTLPANCQDKDIVSLIEGWNHDHSIHGVLVQLPLPSGHDEHVIIQAIDPHKDADGFHPSNVAALLSGHGTIIPPVHEGILHLIQSTPVNLIGHTAVLLVNSKEFAAPLAHLLTTAGLFVHTFQPDELDPVIMRRADIIVVAIGRARFLHAGITKKDVVIIDVGTNHDEHGKLCGDVDIATYTKYDNAYISPVPGGVGPMTIVQLLTNVTRLSETTPPTPAILGAPNI